MITSNQDAFLPPTDETFLPGQSMTEVLSPSDIQPGDVIRIWSDSLPYTFGEKGWLPEWWWCRVINVGTFPVGGTTVTKPGVRLKDLKSGKEQQRSFADTISNPYGVHSYKHPNPDYFR
jgi:hypothetical protein